MAPVLVFARVATAPQAAALDGLRPVAALQRAARELRARFLSSLLVVLVTGAAAWAAAFTLQTLAALVFPGGATGTFAAALGAALAAVVVGPLPHAALTALHRESRAPGANGDAANHGIVG